MSGNEITLEILEKLNGVPYTVIPRSEDYLSEYEKQKQVHLNETILLIEPEYNLVEMIEYVLEEIEVDSIQGYVKTMKDSIRCTKVLSIFNDLAMEEIEEMDKDNQSNNPQNFSEFASIYEQIKSMYPPSLLDENIIESTTQFDEMIYSEEVIIARFPTKEPWEASLWVPMGGFNECPLPEQQAAIYKHWYEKYGAYPKLVSDDTWVLEVRSPPKTNEEALHLAKEHFLFCRYVLEDFSTLGAYAGFLLKSKKWNFWWD
ncbi:DUF4253 domain-containing protein [Heyndrickxia sp. NPDC080065]|uniref:DUF4253 domain-containing protein n=1 Tax=Heyndrickxia sp. NPDC080065 TaxID=3390568 RepID=UPI003D00001A